MHIGAMLRLHPLARVSSSHPCVSASLPGSQGDPIISPPLRLEEGSQGDPIIPSPFVPPGDLLRGDPLGRKAFKAAALLLLLLLLLLPPAAVSSCRPSAILLCHCITSPTPLNKINRGPAAICHLWLLVAIAPNIVDLSIF